MLKRELVSSTTGIGPCLCVALAQLVLVLHDAHVGATYNMYKHCCTAAMGSDGIQYSSTMGAYGTTNDTHAVVGGKQSQKRFVSLCTFWMAAEMRMAMEPRVRGSVRASEWEYIFASCETNLAVSMLSP